jgi:hypothetical protein
VLTYTGDNMQVTLYLVPLVLVSQTLTTNVRLIKTVNYNLEKLNPLREYTTIMLDLPKPHPQTPKRQRPRAKPKKKRPNPKPNHKKVKDAYHKPLVIGNVPKYKKKRSMLRNKKQKLRKPTGRLQTRDSNPWPKPKVLNYADKVQVSEIVEQINKELINMMQLYEAANNTQGENNLENIKSNKIIQATKNLEEKDHLPTNKILKKKSVTFSSLINLGKQSAIDEMEENIKYDGLNNILASFMQEFRLTKSELEAATKQIFKVTRNQDSEKRPLDGLELNAQQNIFSFLDDYSRMLKNEENIYNTTSEVSTKSLPYLLLSRDGFSTDEISQENQFHVSKDVMSEKDLYVDTFF